MPAANIIFMDGFETYNTPDSLVNKWHTTSLGASFTDGRYGGKSLNLTNSIDYTYRSFANNQFLCISFGVFFSSIGTGPFCTVFDGSSQIDLRMNASGFLSITRSGTALTNGTSLVAIRAKVWYWLEWKMMIADSISANSCQVRLNDETIINAATG